MCWIRFEEFLEKKKKDLKNLEDWWAWEEEVENWNERYNGMIKPKLKTEIPNQNNNHD